MQKIDKPKFKHNKKRNTAFLFEAIIKEITKAAVSNDSKKTKFLSSLVKDHFKKNSILDKELNLYKQIYETRSFPKQHAEKLVKEVLQEREKINDQELFNEQSKLIAKLNKFFGPVLYDNFVPNYKVLASISQLFNKSVEPKKKILLENELIEHIISDKLNEKDIKPLDKFTMNKFIEKFNSTYSNALLEEQKLLLTKYINSGDDLVDLKIFLNEEFFRLKKELLESKKSQIILENEELSAKVNKLLESLEKFKFEEINEELIKKTMLIQQFIQEVK